MIYYALFCYKIRGIFVNTANLIEQEMCLENIGFCQYNNFAETASAGGLTSEILGRLSENGKPQSDIVL